MTLNRLTVLLLRDVTNPDGAIRTDKHPLSVPIEPSSGLNGRFYYTQSHPNPPSWVSEVNPVLTTPLQTVLSSSAAGLLILQTSGAHFAITFGYGKSFIDPAKIQRQFGLRVALNRIDPAHLRSMDTKTFEDMVVTRNTQTSKSSDIPTFGVDVTRDILRAVAGEPRDTTFARRLAGSDAVVLSLSVAVTDLAAKCDDLLAAYHDTAYRDNFEWIDHLEVVEDAATIASLDEALVNQLRQGHTSSTHMATPEPIAWEDIDFFTIGGTRQVTYDDLDLDRYLELLDSKKADLTGDRLKSRKVSVRYTRSGNAASLWSVYQCLVSEQRLNGALHVLIEGRWFCISDTLVKQVDRFVQSLPTTVDLLSDAHAGELEPDYNARMASEHPEDFLLLDARIKRPGGASTGIEFCDLLSRRGAMIHIKRKSRSATLSHLFAQGTVSATTLISDGEYRDAVRDAIRDAAPAGTAQKWLALVPDSSSVVRPAQHTVSYVVLAKAPHPGADWLPFFSKLNLMQHGKQLQNMRLGLSITRLAN